MSKKSGGNNWQNGEDKIVIRLLQIVLGIMFGCITPALVLITILRGGF